MNKHADHFLTSLIDFIFRRRTPGIKLIGWGVAVVLAALSGFAFTVVIPLERGPAKFTFDSGASTPALILSLLLMLGLLLIVCGLAWIAYDLRRETRRQVLAVELRGLRDTGGQPLAAAVPKSLLGRRVPLLVNIRQGADGQLRDPDDALTKLENLPQLLQQHSDGLDRRDQALVAGGLAAVPFTFLMGVLLDDENHVTLLDWDRTGECWRSLDEPDDGERLEVSGLKSVGASTEAVVVISVSYPEDRDAIARRFPGLPIVRLALPTPAIDHHWSAAKQAAWATQFFDVARELCGTNVRQIHLVLAAPNSVAITLGRRYDKRNLPALTVHQYENGSAEGYPWGVAMPVSNARRASIVRA